MEKDSSFSCGFHLCPLSCRQNGSGRKADRPISRRDQRIEEEPEMTLRFHLRKRCLTIGTAAALLLGATLALAQPPPPGPGGNGPGGPPPLAGRADRRRSVGRGVPRHPLPRPPCPCRSWKPG